MDGAIWPDELADESARARALSTTNLHDTRHIMAVPTAVDADAAPSIEDFILDACTQPDTRDRWKAQLACQDAAEWLKLERTALLKHLGKLGLPLNERQRLANAVGRRRRAHEFVSNSTAVYVSPADVPRPAGGEATRSEIRQWLLSEDTAEYTSDLGQVKIEHHGLPPLSTWTDDFAECGDASCGCYRIAFPNVRADFRNLVVMRTAVAARAAGDKLAAVHYVSVGCGSLLTDFEILCGLQAQRVVRGSTHPFAIARQNFAFRVHVAMCDSRAWVRARA